MHAALYDKRTLATSDPRLEACVRSVWPQAGQAGSPVSVRLGSGPAGHVAVEEYAVIPHPRMVRFLVPLDSRPATVASFRAFNATRAPLSRAVRATLGSGYALGLADRMFAHRLVVSVDQRFPLERWGDVLVLRHLAAELGHPTLVAFVAVRSINPNAKPTLQLFDAGGTPVGFAKLGTTPATRRMVRTEAAALGRLGGRHGPLLVPRLLTAGQWHDTEHSVSEPLPPDVRRWTDGAEATVPAITRVARSGTVTRTPLTGSRYAMQLRQRIADSRGRARDNEVAEVLCRWLGHLEQDHTPLEFGRGHGDWIRDNLGRWGAGLAAWDWEHSSDDTPIGFDLLHWHFHERLATAGLRAAVSALDAATPRLALLDVPAVAHRFVASLYLLDSFVRRLQLAAGGGGWNARWYPELLEVARTRDAPDAP